MWTVWGNAEPDDPTGGRVQGQRSAHVLGRRFAAGLQLLCRLLQGLRLHSLQPRTKVLPVQSPWVLAHIAAGFLHISLRLFVLAGSIMHIFSDETISRVLINCLDLVFLSKLLQRHNSFFILVIWW